MKMEIKNEIKKLTIWINYKNGEHKKFKNINEVTQTEQIIQLWKQENFNTFTSTIIPIETIDKIIIQ